MFAKMWNEWNSHALLIYMQHGWIATLGKKLDSFLCFLNICLPYNPATQS